jgi:hypothetical protein
MLDGKMLSAYNVTPADPVSKPSGILTGTVPTEVTITVSKADWLDDWFGYRFTVVGCVTAPGGGGGGPPPEDGADPEEPQAVSHAATNPTKNN